MDKTFRLAVLFTVCAGGLGLAAPAGASAPQIESFDVVTDHEPIARCGDFKIIADGVGSTRITTYFDSAGRPTRVVLHGRYEGLLTNSVTGYSITDAPSVANITVDLIQQTQTNVGAFFTITIPGKGVVFFDVGRLVFAGEGAPVFLAGQHHPPEESIGILCDALR